MFTQTITKNVVKGLLRMLNKIKKIKKKDREKTLFLIIGMLSSWSDSREVDFFFQVQQSYNADQEDTAENFKQSWA